ncbi:universal stress protein [Deinococcus peraridilitoris]|uniref:Universal stress protein UspA-like protein n=1 Tax=Deinococcus peraridilitoris (strain DSM 19664 / LMG 22246 / CIP 109416 / KR-200) TaxID=937777 RepID=L0A2U9_DEIPD|nr:universal stress protein [Deinococcus peraridilitoris]AFZ68156.1 universal stress protein UspA-like protein [Deinococcus peraridilitoris DSM 19664]
MFERVLVMMDFSEAALRALETVKTHFPTADITLLHVLESSNLSEAFRTPSAGIGGTPRVREARQDAWEAEVLTRLAELGGGEVLRGDPAEIALAHADRIDLIAVGTGAKSGLSQLLFGSVATRIVRDSPVPVLTVRAL